MPQGMFNKMSGYLFAKSKGFLNAGSMNRAAGLAGMGQAAGYLANNSTARGAFLGGVAGGIYGANSRDTSVLGGAFLGAGIGAGGMRYGRAGILAGAHSGRGILSPFGAGKAYGAAFAGGVRNKAGRDLMRARVWGKGRMAAFKAGMEARKAPSGPVMNANQAINPV